MGSIDNLNSSIIALLAGQSFIGEFVSTISYAEINVSMHTNQLCTLIIHYSSDGLTYELNETFNIASFVTQVFNFTPKLRFYKIQLNNGIDDMGFLNLSSILKSTITYKLITVSIPEEQIQELKPLPTVEPYLQISKSLVSGSTPVYIAGENPGLTGLEDLWSSSVSTWIPPTTATTVFIYSNSAADTAAGTGARTISISGLDGSYHQVSEILTLSGAAFVRTINSYWIIHKMVVLSAGSSNSAVGTISSIWAGNGSPTGPNINPLLNASQSCIYQVPAGHSLYITNYKIASHDGGKSTGYLMAKPLNGVYNCIELCPANVYMCTVIREFQPPMKFLQYTTIKFQTTANTPGMQCFGSIDGILIAN